jgi:2-(1,2-epoxy-1,2-dihydrophenyl)acetyl-CoA isomerase
MEAYTMSYTNLLLERHNGVATITLNRPEKLNALSRELSLEILAVCAEVQDDDDVRAVVFTGAGRGFCSGADLTGPRPAGETPRRAELLDETGWVGRQAKAVYGIDKPTIAAVNGVAAGAGMSLTLACDVRVGSEASRFKTVFIERNLAPDAGMTYFLPRIVGASRAFDLVMTSRAVEGTEAYRLGLLDRFVEKDQLLAQAHLLAEQFAGGAPIAIGASKRSLQHSLDSTFEEQLKYELHAISLARRATEDAKESGLSFREKRAPRWLGR